MFSVRAVLDEHKFLLWWWLRVATQQPPLGSEKCYLGYIDTSLPKYNESGQPDQHKKTGYQIVLVTVLFPSWDDQVERSLVRVGTDRQNRPPGEDMVAIHRLSLGGMGGHMRCHARTTRNRWTARDIAGSLSLSPPEAAIGRKAMDATRPTSSHNCMQEAEERQRHHHQRHGCMDGCT